LVPVEIDRSYMLYSTTLPKRKEENFCLCVVYIYATNNHAYTCTRAQTELEKRISLALMHHMFTRYLPLTSAFFRRIMRGEECCRCSTTTHAYSTSFIKSLVAEKHVSKAIRPCRRRSGRCPAAHFLCSPTGRAPDTIRSMCSRPPIRNNFGPVVSSTAIYWHVTYAQLINRTHTDRAQVLSSHFSASSPPY
jgi:hypothetical protein